MLAHGVTTEGFVAALRASGGNSTPLRWATPNDAELARLEEAFFNLMMSQGEQVLSWLSTRVASPGLSTSRAVPQRSEMDSVLDNLASHSTMLSMQTGLSDYEIRTHLPNLSSKEAELRRSPPFEPFGAEEAKVLALARWFKESYMTWVDPIKCPKCGGPTRSAGSATPTEEERRDGAGRVELHQCEDEGCNGQRRFRRYTRVQTLLRTKEGRCGEWAQLFYVFLQAAGLEARYVWNSEDHVWTEYWSPTLKHWVHVDSCEAAVSKPLVYALGWGKKQAFCIAYGRSGAEDVTRAYVDDFNTGCQARRRARGWSEERLEEALKRHTAACRARCSEEDRTRFQLMDGLQAAWIADEKARLKEAEREELGGRVSGPADWRAARQELGLESVRKPNYKFVRHLSSAESTLAVLGDAKVTDDGIVLTSGSDQTSAVFSDMKLRQTQSFKCDVTFELTAPPGSGEADGIAVVFCREQGVGRGGYGLGYTGLGGEGDFAVEVDTHRARDWADDPPVPHISVHSPPDAHHRHSIVCTPRDSLPWMSDGRVYTLELLYDGLSRTLRGYLISPSEEGHDEIHLFETAIPPAKEGEVGEWYVGVTGSCGGFWQRQEVLEWNIDEISFGDTDVATVTNEGEADTIPKS